MKCALNESADAPYRKLEGRKAAPWVKLVAFSMIAVIVASAFALMTNGTPETGIAPEDGNTADTEADGATRKVTYTISNLGESYKKSTDYSKLGRHDDPGLSQWWTKRTAYYSDAIVHDSYPYVIAYEPGYPVSPYPTPPRTSWVTNTFYRLTTEAENISGLATGANMDPWIVPIMGNNALAGGWVNMSMYLTYLTDQEYTDIAAGTHYANSHYGVVGGEFNSTWKKYFDNDGWLMEAQGQFDFDVDAARKFLGLPGTGSLIDEFNAKGAATIAAAWRDEWIADGDIDRPLDIYAAYDFSLSTGNGPVFIVVKLDEENSTATKVAVRFWSLTWGAEALMVRYLEKVGIYKHWEPYMEDWYLNGTFGPNNGDIRSRQTAAYHMTAWRDTDPASCLSPAWLLEPQHIDHVADAYSPLSWISQFNNYSWGYYGSGYKPTRMCWVPGQEGYGKEVQYWQTPRNWNLTADETLIIKLPIDRQGWGMTPYYSAEHSLPSTAVGEMNAHAVTGEWVLGHGWPSNLYSTDYYDPSTKTLTIPGGSSWEYKGNHDPAYPLAMEQGSPAFVLDISRVSHYNMAITDSPPYLPGMAYALQITPLNLTMAPVYCNQTVVLPAVAGVTYGATSHTFSWNESSWNTTVVFDTEGTYNLVSQDQYFYLDVTDTYAIIGLPAFDLHIVPGWNLVTVPPIGFGYRASTLGLMPGDIVARPG